MIKYVGLCFFLLATIIGVSVRSSDVAAGLVKDGLVLDGSDPSPGDAGPAVGAAPPATTGDASKACAGVSFSRSLRYGESEQNVLDVATIKDPAAASPRPVLVFVAGESFTGDGGLPDIANSMQDEAMCFAARHGMVGVKVSYRLAPANPWPAGARDVAAATSWIRQNIDLFGGSASEIVAIGYSAGAFHVASFLAHPEFQERDPGIAAAVLVSGIYHLSADATESEKSYFGADPGKYDQRSVFPGILNIDTPLLLAWSVLDPPRLVAQAEKLKELLCNSPSQCPHITVLRSREGLSSIFGLDASGGSLAEPTLELVREIEARGLP